MKQLLVFKDLSWYIYLPFFAYLPYDFMSLNAFHQRPALGPGFLKALLVRLGHTDSSFSNILIEFTICTLPPSI